MGAHVGDDAHGVPDGESRDDDGASRRGRRRRGWDDAGARESGRNRAHGARGEKCGEGGGYGGERAEDARVRREWDVNRREWDVIRACVSVTE